MRVHWCGDKVRRQGSSCHSIPGRKEECQEGFEEFGERGGGQLSREVGHLWGGRPPDFRESLEILQKMEVSHY